MTDQERGLAGFLDFALDEIRQLRLQVRPVVGDGKVRVMAEFVERLDHEPARTQIPEQHAVRRCRKTVAVGEDDERHQRRVIRSMCLGACHQ
jgi:hypothetical protein